MIQETNEESIQAIKDLLNIYSLDANTYYLGVKGQLFYIFEVIDPAIAYHPDETVFGAYYNRKRGRWAPTYWNRAGQCKHLNHHHFDIEKRLGSSIPDEFKACLNVELKLVKNQSITLDGKNGAQQLFYTEADFQKNRISRFAMKNGLWKLGLYKPYYHGFNKP
jgi:hypothetical protein